ncbi:hypothetical protein GR197_12265 [Rhizobium phaseoli]|jgi:hypothetical protein|uniref:Uncharacterized protein n=1 Tax=Rhizobium phaseoli TaxID=396 RepID=A0A7K3UDB1_9HYPH|nr:hypothetical protein [Rhizobium phaseoli]NEJ71305.1 hypothetical protein [Rhizobium phaseoli]
MSDEIGKPLNAPQGRGKLFVGRIFSHAADVINNKVPGSDHPLSLARQRLAVK